MVGLGNQRPVKGAVERIVGIGIARVCLGGASRATGIACRRLDCGAISVFEDSRSPSRGGCISIGAGRGCSLSLRSETRVTGAISLAEE